MDGIQINHWSLDIHLEIWSSLIDCPSPAASSFSLKAEYVLISLLTICPFRSFWAILSVQFHSVYKSSISYSSETIFCAPGLDSIWLRIRVFGWKRAPFLLCLICYSEIANDATYFELFLPLPPSFWMKNHRLSLFSSNVRKLYFPLEIEKPARSNDLTYFAEIWIYSSNLEAASSNSLFAYFLADMGHFSANLCFLLRIRFWFVLGYFFRCLSHWFSKFSVRLRFCPKSAFISLRSVSIINSIWTSHHFHYLYTPIPCFWFWSDNTWSSTPSNLSYPTKPSPSFSETTTASSAPI